ncbi:MAG: hypothetical protein COU46_01565 [Candidatus Niyogibacteria bacterium CG10_big_fil_rev_8_21_14_0_10_42_19]|uniref:Peptidase M50 domain-containing protein n=1 Tax=Candidatus Niyogibacteria bacterium CG10_big_fil_rev_8_21_14_0_10_42_19 TaxID=1974725 RepID=A0A2H0TFU0_9BACT|nr:MAG: hypothetical protein COU46_01565 [Candidatus Niyogibacteria bacterium CG10_big_fil_rev_8_21_14_0_10_42_19]
MTIVIFIIILAILILAHEFGHFIIAKKSGVEVSEFGLGFPPRIYSKKIGGTKYSLNLIPFGGFVRIKGEEGEDPNDPGSFASKPAWKRGLILAGGVIFNIILAFVIFSFGAWYGAPEVLDDGPISGVRDPRIMISDVFKDSPAEIAGLETGDEILFLSLGEDKSIIKADEGSSIDSVQKFTHEHAGSPIIFGVRRGGEEFTYELIPRVNPPEGEGPTGIALMRIGLVKTPFYKAFWTGAKETYSTFVFTIRGFYDLIRIALSGEKTGAFVTGPVGLVSIVGTYADFGFSFLIRLIAILSINLAIINLIPFPALDGGRLFFLLIEVLRGKPIKAKTSQIANVLGLLVLLALMLFITIYDIKRFF